MTSTQKFVQYDQAQLKSSLKTNLNTKYGNRHQPSDFQNYSSSMRIPKNPSQITCIFFIIKKIKVTHL